MILLGANIQGLPPENSAIAARFGKSCFITSLLDNLVHRISKEILRENSHSSENLVANNYEREIVVDRVLLYRFKGAVAVSNDPFID